ncbi:MAG: TIGR03905 family TSCPD domain-containing protein [Rikenellaceae bacterium]
MKKVIEYTPQGVCAKQIILEVEDGKMCSAEVIGGCHGNLQGICALINGMSIEDITSKLEGIDCRGRGTSCPDQIVKAIKSNL